MDLFVQHERLKKQKKSATIWQATIKGRITKKPA
jgi:hypothetical protein